MRSIPAEDFKPLFESSPGLYLILLPDLTIVAASDAYLKATMTKREDILDRGLFEVFPDNPEDDNATGVSNLKASLHAVLEFKKPHAMVIQKYDIRRPDGSFEERYWDPLNTPVINTNNEIVYIIHNVKDVTRQKIAEEKLKKSEKDFQLLVSTVKDYSICMLDENGIVASWNSGAEHIKGYNQKEIIGKSFKIFYSAEEIKKKVPDYDLEMAKRSGHFETEGWRVRKDGSMFWANVVLTALRNDKDELYGYSKITRDVTERKNAAAALGKMNEELEQRVKERTEEVRNSEEKYRIFIQRVTDAFIAVDKDWRYTYLNQQAGKMIHHDPDSLIGRNVWEIFPEAVNSPTYRAFHRAMKEQRYISNIDYYEPLDLWQENHIYPSEDGLSVFIRDITEKKRLEFRLQDQQRTEQLKLTAAMLDAQEKKEMLLHRNCTTT
jgi:PAS domain S-box-containing protein